MSAPSENNKKPTHTTQEKGKWVARNNNGQINDTQETNGS
jgi:hypothetical protein